MYPVHWMEYKLAGKKMAKLKLIGIIYLIIGALHSILFSVFISRSDCINPKGLVYYFCNTGISISHAIVTLGWPFYWLPQQSNANQADTPPNRSPAELAASFALETCYNSLDDISRVKSYANIMRWQKLSADSKKVIRPLESGEDFEAWLVHDNGTQYFVLAHIGSFQGKPSQICQVYAPVSVEQTVASIGRKVSIRQLQTADIGMQRYEIYQLIKHPTGRPAFLLVSKNKDGEKDTLLAFMGIEK